MGQKAVRVLAVAALAAFGLSACYTLLEKPIVKRRDFKPFAAKEYPAPCQYLQVEDVNLAYIEKGEGPTVILLHGGFIPMNLASSFSRTPISDLLLFNFLYTGVILPTPIAPIPVVLPQRITPPRGQTFAHLGAVATIDTWGKNFDELAKQFHVIALDLPGFGNSDKPNLKYKVEDFTRYLTGFMDAKKIGQADLVGLDIGGMIALDFVLTHPERVNKLVLINTEGTHNPLYNLFFTRIPGINKLVVLPVFGLWQKEKAAEINVWMPFYKHLWLKRGYRNILHEKSQGLPRNYIAKDEGTSKEFMDQVISYKVNYVKTQEFTQEVQALHKTLINIKRRDLRLKIVQNLKTIQAPTLIIWGQQNPRPKIKKGSGEAELLNNAIPNSSLNVFAQSGHFPMVEEPQAFNLQLIQFLGGQVKAQAAPNP